jgi:uncharacterized protein YbbC (DUF1343 family)
MRRTYAALLFMLLAWSPIACAERVRIGAEVLLAERMDLLAGKRVGIICNHTSVLPNGVHLADTLLRRGVRVTALFGPEHGVRGIAAAGETVGDHPDPATGIPVFSLYGKTRTPSDSMLAMIDVMIFDVQDVGARFYTYASTMAYAMQACSESGKEFIVLDRPNPIGGVEVEGPVLDRTLQSFLGLFPIPVRHGLTIGELARMIIGEGWIDDTKLALTVVPMQGWRRSMWYDETGLPWVPPSPNMKTLATATVYPGMCFVEATNVSEGRGTPTPFEVAGAPGVDADSLALALNALRLPGVSFTPASFTPVPDAVAAPDPKFKNKLCSGVALRVTDRGAFRPVLTGLAVLREFQRRNPTKFTLREGMLDRLLGDNVPREKFQQGLTPVEMLATSAAGIERYKQARQRYLLYAD